MARMYDNDGSPSKDFGDCSQLINWILDSRVTCHMTPKFSVFIPGSLKNMGKNIEVVDGHHVTTKQKRQVQIKMCKDNGDTFVLLAADLCNMLFSIITLMNLVHSCLFNKGLCTVYFGNKDK